MDADPASLRLTAVLPAFNEVDVIADVVTRVDEALRAAGVAEREIVVVDDGSTDGTAAAIEALGLPSVVVVRHERNRGYGAALRTGFETASLDHVWLLDSDGQFDPADLAILLGVFRPDAYVIGVRINRRDNLLRRLNHDVFFALTGVLVGSLPRDVNCAFRLFPRALGVGLRSDGAIISTEMAIRAREQGMPRIEVPVPHHPRTTGTATGARPSVVLRAFVELWRLRRRVAREPHPWATDRAAEQPPGS